MTFDKNAFPVPVERFKHGDKSYSVWDLRHIPVGIHRTCARPHGVALHGAQWLTIRTTEQSDYGKSCIRNHAAVDDDLMRGWLNCPPWVLADVDKNVAVWREEDRPVGTVVVGYRYQSMCSPAQALEHSLKENTWRISEKPRDPIYKLATARIDSMIDYFAKRGAPATSTAAVTTPSAAVTTPAVLPCVGPLAADLALAARIGSTRERPFGTVSGCTDADRKAASEAWSRALRDMIAKGDAEAKEKDRTQVLVQRDFEDWE